jgi:uncharacterized protein (UPF0332 family)
VRPESKDYLAKSRESLASAEADLEAGRFNSAASRAYYASFQAAIAALIEYGIRPRGRSWEHRFVMSEFSGKLIARRKVVSSALGGKLELLLTTRLAADYGQRGVSRRYAGRSVQQARAFVQQADLLESE